MREVLFRGQRTDNGQWVYGLLTDLGLAEKEDFAWISGVKVYKNTVGQYTGLTDKNGKKIFEGDILEITNRYYGRTEKSLYQIKWYDSTASWCAFGLGFVMRVPLYDNEKRSYKVIGTVHDNPEQMKERFKGDSMKKYFYSNCLLEAVKAKLKDWKNIKITYIPPKYNECYCPHFLWSDGKNDYDFGVERYLKWYERLCFKGEIRKRKLGWNKKWKSYRIARYKRNAKYEDYFNENTQ